MRSLRIPITLLLFTACSGAPGEGPGAPVTVNCRFTPQPVQTPHDDLIQVRSDDGSTCVRLLREDISEPGTIYKAKPYKITEMVIGINGQSHHVTDDAALEYEPTHHNWSDRARASVDGVRHQLSLLYQCCESGDWRYELRTLATDSDQVLEGPIELSPVAPLVP